jgi:hypothetical protein
MSRANLAAQEEARLALAATAARAERQNQPKVLLYGAGLLLLIALIFLGTSFRTSVAAASDLRAQRKQAEDIVKDAGELKAIREAVKSGPVNQSAIQVRTRIEQAGADVGLKARVPTANTRTDPQPGLHSKQMRYDYEIRDEELPKLLQWVQKSVQDVPGLEVYSISLKPEAHQWTLRVSFSRWERIETQ